MKKSSKSMFSRAMRGLTICWYDCMLVSFCDALIPLDQNLFGLNCILLEISFQCGYVPRQPSLTNRKGFLHPIIHLGFGVEFKQPAIIAEGLAQAAVHDNWIGPLLLAAEKASSADKSKSMVEILDEIRADKKLSTAAHWDDADKIRDGLITRAPDEMIEYASQRTVRSDELEAKTAEMINAAGITTVLSDTHSLYKQVSW